MTPQDCEVIVGADDGPILQPGECMRAVTVVPGRSDSLRIEDVPEPATDAGAVLVEAVAVGICGTDAEIAAGAYGWSPPDRERLILGHESLGRVLDPGPSGFEVGELVVGIVRRPDPAPCPNCAVGEWDMCSNGRYTERGIKQADGFMSERWRIESDYAVRVDPRLGVLGVLLEPMSVVAKAWEHIAAIGRRTFWEPRTALIVGAGPIGLLGALIGVQHGLEVHVLDRVRSGPKPELVEALGATYHSGGVDDLGVEFDIVLECTGVTRLVQQSAKIVAPGGIVCLTGVGVPDPALEAAANLATEAVLKNLVVFGSVNANRRHYHLAARELAAADLTWLERLVTRRVGLDEVSSGLEREADDIKVVIEISRL
jgi:threonine dehydrogenase-like Zn-dependent dehydrogenase